MIIARYRHTMGLRGKMADDSDKDYNADLNEESEGENTREELGEEPDIKAFSRATFC